MFPYERLAAFHTQGGRQRPILKGKTRALRIAGQRSLSCPAAGPG